MLVNTLAVVLRVSQRFCQILYTDFIGSSALHRLLWWFGLAYGLEVLSPGSLPRPFSKGLVMDYGH